MKPGRIAIFLMFLVCMLFLGGISSHPLGPVLAGTGSAATASELGTQESEASEEDVPETEASETETEAPETETPETEAPETEAPETEAPETEAPETEAPETEAPESEAPETEVPESETPGTKAPEAEAPEIKTGKTADEEKPLITAIWHDTYDLEQLPTVEVTRNDIGLLESLYHFIVDLLSVSASVQYPDGTVKTCTLRVVWDSTNGNNTIDPSVTGLQTDTGRITLKSSQDFEFSEDVPQTLTLPVSVVAPEEKIIITRLQHDYESFIQARAVPTGSDASAITNLEKRWNGYDEDGNIYIGLIEWDSSGIDFETPGVYSLIGTLAPAEYCVFSEDLDLPVMEVSISVQDPGTPEIPCFSYLSHLFTFPWVTPPGSLSSISIWLSEDNGSWREVTGEDGVSVTEEGLSISDILFSAGSRYRLQAEYEGGKTGVFSFVFDEIPTIEDYVQGDRDGGDSDGNSGNKPAEGGQRPPLGSSRPGTGGKDDDNSDDSSNDNTNDNSNDSGNDNSDGNSSENSSQENSENESSGNDSDSSSKGSSGSSSHRDRDRNSTSSGTTQPTGPAVVLPSEEPAIQSPEGPQTPQQIDLPSAPQLAEDELYGSSLLLMLAAKGKAQFSDNGISISLPAESFEAQIQPEDVFKVAITKRTENSFSIEIQKNGSTLTSFPGMKITLPYHPQSEHGLLYLKDESLETVSLGAYSRENGTVSFTADNSGIFTIAEEAFTSAASAADAEKNDGPTANLPEHLEDADSQGNTVSHEDASTQSQKEPQPASVPFLPVFTAILAAAALFAVKWLKQRRNNTWRRDIL